MVHKCENDSHFPHLPFLIPININCPEFFFKRAVFPVKSKLQKPFWPQSYGINLEKFNSFIPEQIRMIEFCPFGP